MKPDGATVPEENLLCLIAPQGFVSNVTTDQCCLWNTPFAGVWQTVTVSPVGAASGSRGKNSCLCRLRGNHGSRKNYAETLKKRTVPSPVRGIANLIWFDPRGLSLTQNPLPWEQGTAGTIFVSRATDEWLRLKSVLLPLESDRFGCQNTEIES